MTNTDCIFCKILRAEIPASKVYEDDYIFAFNDINPVSPRHILIIPKIHKESLNDFAEGDLALLGKILLLVPKIAQQEGFAVDGYRLVNNTGIDGGQTVGHLHFHLLAGRRHQWPPG